MAEKTLRLKIDPEYLEYIRMKACLRELVRMAEADSYSDFSVVVADMIEEECPFALRGPV